MFAKNKNITLTKLLLTMIKKNETYETKFVGQAETWSRRELNENWTKSCTMRRTCVYMLQLVVQFRGKCVQTNQSFDPILDFIPIR